MVQHANWAATAQMALIIFCIVALVSGLKGK
jgi:hypothetical protein